jgi:S-adenosylmethionine-diacylglycerol 3-amino-3-carboxypropyl transferase
MVDLKESKPVLRHERLGQARAEAGAFAKRMGNRLQGRDALTGRLKSSLREDARHTRIDRMRKAVHQHGALTSKGVLERAFTFAFRGMVYPQIWEDPEIDLEALQLGPDHHMVTIASGGCNVMSYLVAGPASITAVDLNRAHIALNRLKLTAAQQMPDWATFFRFFGQADSRANPQLYKRYISAHLDEESRAYWEKRDSLGRRRINFFAKNVYRYGLLGTFIGAGHKLARVLGADPRRLLEAKSLEEQREIFDRELAPLFERKVVKWLVEQPMSLYGLGIPPAQYKALAASGGGDMKQVLLERLERLACDFEIGDNYFAWQAFGRRYGDSKDAPVPPYLRESNWDAVRANAPRVQVRHINFIEFLKSKPDQSLDRYVLLDAQDWMNDEILTTLWTEITRTAKPGSRVIFRTAAEESLLPGRIPDALLDRWSYDLAQCQEFTKRDRSSIYGGFHLYELKPSFAGAA